MGLTLPRLTFPQRCKLLWGKVRRFYLSVFRRRYIRKCAARRQGECARCGACCVLGYRCQSLRHNGEFTECAIHKFRPPNCRVFPIDERDLADRDLILPDTPCGYRFAPEPCAEPTPEPAPQPAPPTAEPPPRTP